MGVKDLWSILSPSCEKKSLWELQGLTIAIDLSSWIVDSQSVGDKSVMNMYLRNIFFRTSYLLLLGVKPIFVLEGKAPTLKHGTIARRQQALRKESKNPSISKNGSRGRLNCLQKKCEELLMSLGVRCYKSEGEAEALCSRLNELGVVDAVISQDGDCFLYGAQTVLRNFTMSPAYTCDMYIMDKIQSKLGLGRQKLLALSLLCGCDYEAGVQGVGKQSALKFLETVSDYEVLDRLRGWRNDDSFESQVKFTQMNPDNKLEYTIRKKALIDPSFPSEEVISEFMSSKSVDVPSFIWIKPSLPSFVVIAERMLAWEDEYIFSKFMPLVTRWHLLHEGADCGLKLKEIIKKRSVRSMPSYELRWQHDGSGEVKTVEPIQLVAQIYPELHEAYMKSKEKPKKGVKSRTKKNCPENELDDVENLMKKLDISGNQSKQPCKKRSKQNRNNGLQTLDRFIIKETPINLVCTDGTKSSHVAIFNSTPIRHVDQSKSFHYLSDELDMDSPVRKNNCNVQKLLDTEVNKDDDTHSSAVHNSNNFKSFADLSEENLDLSDIVNSIVSRTNCNPAIKIWTNRMK